MAITYTQADLDALNAALLTGAEEVRIGDRVIRYRTQSQLLKLIEMVQAAVDGRSPDAKSAKLIKASFSKGES